MLNYWLLSKVSAVLITDTKWNPITLKCNSSVFCEQGQKPLVSPSTSLALQEEQEPRHWPAVSQAPNKSPLPTRPNISHATPTSRCLQPSLPSTPMLQFKNPKKVTLNYCNTFFLNVPYTSKQQLTKNKKSFLKYFNAFFLVCFLKKQQYLVSSEV